MCTYLVCYLLQGGGAFGGGSNGIPSGGSGGGTSGAGNAGPSASSGGGGSWGSWALFVQTLVWTGAAVFAAWLIGDSVKGGLQSAGNSVKGGLQSAGNSVQAGLKEGLTDAAEEHGSRVAQGMTLAAGIGAISAVACVVVQWHLQSRGGGGAAGGHGDINAAIISRLLSAPQGYTVAEPEDLGDRLLATAAATGRPLQAPKTATAAATSTTAAGQQQHASAQGAFNGGSGGNGGSGK
ncbi:hypothetical protein HXX76_009913 [Chlamydomonas incerta]|uniref:Uncharacterized protein n=1 Tax=Chlamydomonas incerta TaxID=51695 RepID=A0A835VWY8_CHLIN|nr:hypothetical protein HXX76_009913 [Chlamydomonas incerta]|eukprot:KAG2430945.1 hypothetical protein HXX76_009913 [Chlamydomonas incerta]